MRQLLPSPRMTALGIATADRSMKYASESEHSGLTQFVTLSFLFVRLQTLGRAEPGMPLPSRPMAAFSVLSRLPEKRSLSPQLLEFSHSSDIAMILCSHNACTVICFISITTLV